jgi:putative secretion ATPase (PEP-CTERM system associated)
VYEKFYGLDSPPFLLTPDTRFFFSSGNHKRAITHLVYGLDQREGFIVITGEVGAGKTMLMEQLWLQLNRDTYAVSKVVTTQVSGDDLLRLVMDGFGVDVPDRTEKSALLRQFGNLVRELRAEGRRCVLVVDEVQNLSFAALEELRMLSNITVDGKASVQTILLGQPQFRPILASRDAEQLRQRVLASYHLGPLIEVETRLYIEHRLRTAGWNDDPHWEKDAFAAVHRHTGGIPRRINTLCSRVLQFAALGGLHSIVGTMVEEVADELHEGLNAAEPPPGSLIPMADGPSGQNGHAILPAHATQGLSTGRASSKGAGVTSSEVLHRIEALEEASARQDRIFQRIMKLLAAAVERAR